MFKFIPGIKKILLLQRNEYQSNFSKYFRKILGREIHTRILIDYLNNNIDEINKKFYQDIQNEFLEFKKLLPNNVKNVLDIGCGIGAINIFLNNYYKKEKPNFHLLDKNYVSNKIIYGFNKKNTEGYNNLLITKNFLKANNLIEENIYTYDVEKHELKKIKYDLVISLVSWGYHYPLENYINYLKENSDEKTIFIFDIAEEFISINHVKKYFHEIKIVNKYLKKHRQIRLACKKII